ncbi:hypothetical protein P7D75_22185, partial [Enterococcus avium]|nr:hypothetical protein [Enterococcus avium]
ISNYIDDNGFFYTLVYSDPSDGKTATRVVMDYTNVVFTMGISANEHIKSMIAANHVENLATQEEAETGIDNTKTMTPLRTAQQIEKKAVAIAGNQTIGGIKSFKDGLMINDDLVVSKNDHSVFILNPSNCDKLIDGYIVFIKHGSEVIVGGSCKFKSGVAFNSSIFTTLPIDMSAKLVNGIINGSGADNSSKIIFVEKDSTILKSNSTFVANEWFTCNGVYWAGKE